MALSDIIADVKNRIETAVPGAVVHGYDRWSDRWGDFLALMKTSSGVINGYMISRTAAAAQRSAYDLRERAQVIRIRGFYGLDDSANTEATFQAQVEAIDAAFDIDDETLGGVVNTHRPYFGPMSGADGIQIDTVEHRVFGPALCHYAELRLGVIE
jgi:hypothetical protein